MTTFKNLESLEKFLTNDSKRTSLNPIRFINVDSMGMWVEVKKILLSLADGSMPLSKFCDGSDTTPNINRISAALKTVSESQFVTPLSEYLRIVPEAAESIIQRFIKADYQNNDNGKLRIYFLMYRMKSLLRTLPSEDPRTKDCVVLFETDEESDYRLTIVQKELDVKLSGNEIEGFKSYLEYWEANPDKPLILHTSNAIHFEKNHFFDDVHVIVTSYDLIKYQYGLPSTIDEELGSNENWNELVKVIIKEGAFDDACRSTLSINRYSLSLFDKWSNYNSFQKWILWIWTRQQTGKRYEVESAKSCQTLTQFLDELYCRIVVHLKEDNLAVLYEERKDILSRMKTVPTEHFWSEISTLNTTDALSCLTCLTDIERKTIFEIVSNYNFQERTRVLPVLKMIYPDLYYYIQNDEHPNAAALTLEHEQYFSEYKWLKVTDRISENFLAKVNRIALEKGASVFAMKPRNHCVSEQYDDNTLILFVDGMGIEYVDYLSHLFSDLDEKEYSVSFEAGFCNLPSITEINKDFMDGRKTVEPPIRELDELKHANNVHPESLIKQLQILESLKNRVLGLLVGSIHRIIIAADHGTSRMAVKIRNTKYDNSLPKPENRNVYKYGRFCEGTEDEASYPTAINYNDRIIFADYTRFVQSGAPIDEIHGGASLEEWIVPVVCIEKFSSERKAERVIIKPQEIKYKPELGTKQIRVKFTINGSKRDNISARIKGTVTKCEWDNGVYSFVFVPDKNDTTLTVKISDGGILGEFEIQVEQGIKKNDKFDI